MQPEDAPPNSNTSRDGTLRKTTADSRSPGTQQACAGAASQAGLYYRDRRDR